MGDKFQPTDKSRNCSAKSSSFKRRRARRADLNQLAATEHQTTAGGDKGGKYVSFMLNGRKRGSSGGDTRVVKSVTFAEEVQDDEAADDAEEEDNAGADTSSASSAFGRGATNRHAENLNKKKRTMKTVHVMSYKITKTVATPILTPSDYNVTCPAEIDSRADTICCRKPSKCLNSRNELLP
jgi:hypothetical protein